MNLREEACLHEADGNGHVVFQELGGAHLPAFVELVLIAALRVLLGRAIAAEEVVDNVERPLAHLPPGPILPLLQVLRLSFLAHRKALLWK